MKTTSPSVDDIILQIHAAPLEPQGWQSVMTSLIDICQAESAAMITIGDGPVPSSKQFVPTREFNPGVVENYPQWVSQDLLLLGAKARGRIRPGLVSTEVDLMDLRQFASSAYFNEFLKLFDIERQLNVCLTQPLPELSIGAAAITLYRGVGDRTFEDSIVTLLRHLGPHLALAARTTWHIESLSMAEPIYRRTLDEIRIPFFALDMSGKVALLNRAGEELIGSKNWIARSAGMLIASNTLLHPDDFRHLLSKLKRGIGSTLLLTDGASSLQAIMTAVPVGEASRVQEARTSIAGILWVLPVSAPPSTVQNLGKLFQLTTAEIRLFQLLVNGVHLSDAAEDLQTTLNTVRTQLKAIFRKTGQRTQGQLLALANRMSTIRS